MEWVSRRLGIAKNVSAASRALELREVFEREGCSRQEVVAIPGPNEGVVAALNVMSSVDKEDENYLCNQVGQKDQAILGLTNIPDPTSGVTKIVQFKGKGISLRKVARKPHVPLNCNGKLVIRSGKESGVNTNGVFVTNGFTGSSGSSGSALNVDSGLGPLEKYPKVVGESSKARVDNCIGGNFYIDLGAGRDQILGQSFKEVLLKDGNNTYATGKIKEADVNKSVVPYCNDSISFSSSENSISHVSETQQQNLDNSKDNSVLEMTLKKKVASSKKANKNNVPVRSHGMKTRNNGSLVSKGIGEVHRVISGLGSSRSRWNLEVELAKVVEKGVDLGYLRRDKVQQGGGSIEPSSWRLSEEVAKVIEVGAALGFDFNRNKESISKEISRREKEDEDRYVAV